MRCHGQGDAWCSCGWVNWEECEIVLERWTRNPRLVELARRFCGVLCPVERTVLEQDFGGAR